MNRAQRVVHKNVVVVTNFHHSAGQRVGGYSRVHFRPPLGLRCQKFNSTGNKDGIKMRENTFFAISSPYVIIAPGLAK